MPDISKCEGTNCPLKEKCHRFTCEPDEHYQAYSDFSDALNEEKTECDYIIKIRENNN